MNLKIDVERLAKDFAIQLPEKGKGTFDSKDKVEAFNERIEETTRDVRERDRKARTASLLAAHTMRVD